MSEIDDAGTQSPVVSPGPTTVAHLPFGLYDHAGHRSVRDYAQRRYHPFAFDFDSTPMSLDDPGEHWDEKAKELHLHNREIAIERFKAEYGGRHIESVLQNIRALGSKSFSIVSYHNLMHEQARRAFVAGYYFPALVAACALGERILNHLVLDLRDSYKASGHYKKVYRSESFDDWPFAVGVLTDWNVLLPGVGDEFLTLASLRNRSIHFNPETYATMRDDALAALKTLGRIIATQFGAFGPQPWFIENTPGAQFIKRDWEDLSFVRRYLVPASGFVGIHYGMDFSTGYWRHIDYDDYGPEPLDDAAFAAAYRTRDHAQVLTKAKLDQNIAERLAGDAGGNAG